MKEWTNYGDVSFLSYGGTMVRPAYDEAELKEYPLLAGTYDVLIMSPDPDWEGHVIAFLKQVDISDIDAQVRENMMANYGYFPEEEACQACLFAWAMGFEPSQDRTFSQQGKYSAYEEAFITTGQAAEWLRELGVPEEYIK